MVDVALQDLTPEQLILFIQSFGTPINSMSKLLALLDQAIVDNVEAVNRVLNVSNGDTRKYLLQFIEVQQIRGAKNGHIAMKFLKSANNEQQVKEKKTVEKVDMLERFDPMKARIKATNYRAGSGKYTSSAHSFRVSSLLGDIVDTSEPMDVVMMDTKTTRKLKLSESGRNVHHTLSDLIHSTHPFEIEKYAHRQLNFKSLKQAQLAHLINSMCIMLREECDKLTVNKTGIILDWLVQFDSELITTNQDVQLSLLFGKHIQIYRPYLLSLLIHQANWSTIAVAIENLLHPNNSGIYDPTSVMDFIEATIRNPKLWQGKDKAVPKHEQIEYVLLFDDNKTKAFIDYILREEESIYAVFGESKMNDRVKLLLSCVKANELSLKMIRAHLDTNNTLDNELKKKFLRLLYMSIPHLFLGSQDAYIKNLVTEVNELKDSNGSIGDKWTHTIITTLASLSITRDFQTMGADTELSLRKFAATHPILLLRELPLISSLLAGRGHMDLHVLRQEHHIPFFSQVLGIFELLQPMIFDDIYMHSLHKGLHSYFTLLHYHSKDLYGITYRTMEFVRCYAAANPTSAYILINNNSELFTELYMRNKSIIPLQQIMTSVQFLAKGICVQSLTTKQIDSNQMNFTLKLGNISRMSHEELLTTLQEIDYQTHKRPLQLVDIFGKLTELIFNDSSDVRNLSHSMLLKMLKHNPGNTIINSTCFNAYLQCLHSDDINIASSVLNNLTEITLSLQEHALDILNCVFNIGITSKVNTFAPLKKCINAIKLQNGC
jgi:integrator complex subunit 1